MPIVRVLLSQLPQILRDIFEHEILHQPDLELVHEVRHVLSMPGSRGAAPDVVIVGTGSTDDPQTPLTLLARWPHARIMMVTPTEGEAALCELRLHTTELGRVSPSEIVRWIRKAVL